MQTFRAEAHPNPGRTSMLVSFPKLPANDPALKGKLAARKQLFGEFHRYAVAPIHSRFGTALIWFVWDAHMADENGDPAIIRQDNTLEKAIAGL